MTHNRALIGPMRHLRLAEINMDLADRAMAKSPRDESVTAPLHTAMVYLQQALLAAGERLKRAYPNTSRGKFRREQN